MTAKASARDSRPRMRLQQLRLRQRADLAAVTVMIGALVVLGVGCWNHWGLSALLRDAIDNHARGSWLASQIGLQAAECLRHTAEFESSFDDADARFQALQSWTAANHQLEALLDAYAEGDIGRVERRHLDIWRDANAFHRDRFLQIARRVDNGELATRAAVREAMSVCTPTIQDVVQQARALAKAKIDHAGACRAALQKRITFGTCVLALSAVIVLALVLAWSSWLIRRVLDRVARVSSATVRVVAGERNVRVSPTPSDELGTLAEGFNDMAAAFDMNQVLLSVGIEQQVLAEPDPSQRDTHHVPGHEHADQQQ